MLVGYESEVLLDASLGAPDRDALRRMTQLRHGEAVTALGRTRFAVQALLPPFQLQRVITFVREPASPEGGPAFVTALVALTTLLVGVAATVAYAVARDANEEVVFLTQRVRGMVRARTEPTVSCPVTWETLERVLAQRAPDRLQFRTEDVLKRVEKHGDLFAPVLKLKQRLPS